MTKMKKRQKEHKNMPRNFPKKWKLLIFKSGKLKLWPFSQVFYYISLYFPFTWRLHEIKMIIQFFLVLYNFFPSLVLGKKTENNNNEFMKIFLDQIFKFFFWFCPLKASRNIFKSSTLSITPHYGNKWNYFNLK